MLDWIASDPDAPPDSLRIVVEPKYEGAATHVDGSAPVKIGTNWGYIDSDFDVLLEPQYDEARHFEDGIAAVVIDGHWRLIDTAGDFVSETEFEDLHPWFEGPIQAKQNGKWGFLDNAGKFVDPPQYEEPVVLNDGMFKVEINNKYGFANEAGKLVIPVQFEKAANFSESVATVLTKDMRFAVVDRTGNFVIEPQQNEIGAFNNGLARAKVEIPKDKRFDSSGNYMGSVRTGFVDKSNRWVIDFAGSDKFPKGPFKEGLAAVEDLVPRKDEPTSTMRHCGYIDKSGQFKIRPIYGECGEFTHGVAVVELHRGDDSDRPREISLIDRNGDKVVPTIFDNASASEFEIGNEDGFHYVSKNDLRGVVSAGEVLIPIQFEDVYYINRRLFAVKLNGKWGVMNEQATYLLKPQFDEVGVFGSGYAPVKLNDKWGYIGE